MTTDSDHLARRINDLAGQFDGLHREVKAQNQRIAALEQARAPSLPAPEAAPDSAADLEMPADQLMSWVDRSSLLPRVSTVCFILVMALTLRALTDYGLIAKPMGSLLGLGYAAALILVGWRLMAAGHRLGVVFPSCGALLLYAVVLETHARFGQLPNGAAYLILATTMLALGYLGHRHYHAFFNGLGILGASLTAVLTDLPRPFFPYPALLLLTANLTMHATAGQQRCRWGHGLLVALTTIFWIYWAMMLYFPMSRGLTLAPDTAAAWFPPLLILLAASHYGITTYKALTGRSPLDVLDLLLPTITILWAYPAAYFVIGQGPGSPRWLGIMATAVALLHLATAAAILKWSKNGGPGICAFTFAGAVLLVMALPPATGSLLIPLLVWGGVAFFLAMASNACEIGGIRLTSYLLQGGACVIGLATKAFTLAAPSVPGGILVSGLLAVIGGYQYLWSRRHPLSCTRGFFPLCDPHDRTALIPLVAALVYGFCMLNLAFFLAISGWFPGDAAILIKSVQSIIINAGAIGLMIYGLRETNREVLLLSVLVVALGGFKVFAYDFFKLQGLPLVLSVFSFGAVAAAGSLAFGRWQQARHG